MVKSSKTKTKKGASKAMQYKSRRARVSQGVPERASLTVKESITLNANQVYQQYNTTLLGYTRATTVAKGYQLFRIKRITFTIKPQADTFVPNGNNQIPYLYQMIDRTGALSKVTTADQIRQFGAKARRVDEKTVTWSYRPSVLQAVLDNQPVATSNFQSYKISPWLSCDNSANSPAAWTPSEVDHMGMVWIVDQVNNAGAVTYQLDRTVEFEFCKPALDLVTTESGPPPLPAPVPIDPAYHSE